MFAISYPNVNVFSKFTINRYKNVHHTLNVLLHYLVKCKRLDTVAGSVCESAVLLKNKKLSQQLVSGIRICYFVGYRCILNKFCDNVNN